MNRILLVITVVQGLRISHRGALCITRSYPHLRCMQRDLLRFSAGA